MNPICPYCSSPSKRISGDLLYPHRPDLRRLTFYQCIPCQAHVGCHPGTDRPLGRLANAELRKIRQEAHQYFDTLWKNQGTMKRKEAYSWLARKLGISVTSCHIGEFDVETCKKVIKYFNHFND